MANIFKEFNKNANRIEFIYYVNVNKPIEFSKTDSFQCHKCKIEFDTFTDYNQHLITSEHIILSFAIPKSAKNNNKKEKKSDEKKTKKLSTTNIQTIKPSIIQNIPVTKKYDIKSEHIQNVQLNKSLTNLDVDGRILLDNIQTVQKSVVNNNFPEKVNDYVQKDSNMFNEFMKLTPTYNKHRQQYTNYFKHKITLLKKLSQYEELIMKTLSYYCDVCDFIAVEKYVWDKHNQTEHPLDSNRPLTYCSTCFMFVIIGNNQEHNRTMEHNTLLNYLQSIKPVEVLKDKTSLVKSNESCSSDKNCINLERKEKVELNNIDCFKESKYSQDNNPKNSDASLIKELSTNREDPMILKNTILLLDKTENKYEHKQDETNTPNTSKLIHSEITTSSNNLVNTLITIPYQANTIVENMIENINLVNVSTDNLVLNQVENVSTFKKIVKSQDKIISNFDETTLPPLTNKTQIFENKKLYELDEDQLYGEYVIQRLKNIKNMTIKQRVKLEIDYIFCTKMKQLLQENTKC